MVVEGINLPEEILHDIIPWHSERDKFHINMQVTVQCYDPGLVEKIDTC